MENDILQQILSELKELKQGQAKLETEMSERFNRVDERFNRVDERFSQMDRRFDKVDANIKALWRDMDIAFDKLEDHQRTLHNAG